MISGQLDAVFLDRDGTLNEKAPEGCYIASPGDLRLLPGVAEAVRRLNDAGALVVIVTNQRGVALGEVTLEEVAGVHDALQEHLSRSGAQVDRFYVCPHDEASCSCRKPAPGLLLQAAADHPFLRLEHTVMIGDSEGDVEAGLAVGARAIKLGPPGTRTRADALFADLPSAVAALVGTDVPPTAGGAGPAAGARPEEGNASPPGHERAARVNPDATNFALDEVAKLMRGLTELGESYYARLMAQVASTIAASLAAGGKALFCGNGGSAADAQHLAAELVGRQNYDRAPAAGIALSVDTSVLTALGNDYSYAEVFARQVRALGREGDVLVGISTSGRSKNVVNALAAGRAGGLTTVAFTGRDPRDMAIADYILAVPADETAKVQELQLVVGHIIFALVERSLFARPAKGSTVDLRLAP